MIARAVSCHAGSDLGDGEFSGGAVYEVHRISCHAALALITPHYVHITELARGDFGRFRLGRFHCTFKAAGPVHTKTCRSGSQSFSFV